MNCVSFAPYGKARDMELVPMFGYGVGQIVDPHQKAKNCNKKASKTEVFKAFWSC